jgi:hypothetical protein
MASVDMDGHRSYRDRRRADRREYWLIFCLVYPQFLAAAVFGRLAALAGRPTVERTGPRRSVFSEAREAAASCIPFAFR